MKFLQKIVALLMGFALLTPFVACAETSSNYQQGTTSQASACIENSLS